MDRHIARTIVRNSAGDARVIWSIFSGYHPQGLRESGAYSKMAAEEVSYVNLFVDSCFQLSHSFFVVSKVI